MMRLMSSPWDQLGIFMLQVEHIAPISRVQKRVLLDQVQKEILMALWHRWQMVVVI